MKGTETFPTLTQGTDHGSHWSAHKLLFIDHNLVHWVQWFAEQLSSSALVTIASTQLGRPIRVFQHMYEKPEIDRERFFLNSLS